MARRTISAVALSTALFLMALAALFIGLEGELLQADEPTTRYVAPTGDCGGATPCHATIQEAVDAASDGDTLKVAQGLYTSTAFQVVYVNKAITLTGGYTTTDWTNSYPLTQTSVIDAENVARRRGVYIDGSGIATVTLEGLTVQGGYADNAHGAGIYVPSGKLVLRESRVLSNTATVHGCGGGLYATGATLILTNNTFRNNVGGSSSSSTASGGGVYASESVVLLDGNAFIGNRSRHGGGLGTHDADATLSENVFEDNQGWGSGGGILVERGTAILIENTFQGNSSGGPGGGAGLEYCSTITVTNNVFVSNTALSHYGAGLRVFSSNGRVTTNVFQQNEAKLGGGGLQVEGGDLTLEDNRFESNEANNGGGVHAYGGTITLTGNVLLMNIAGEHGGGLYVYRATVTMNRNSIVENTANVYGGGIANAEGTIYAWNDVIAGNRSLMEGIYLAGGDLTARHWTLVDNGDYALTASGGTAALTNTLVASHTLGGLAGSGIVADHTLFFNTGTPCSSGASCSNSLTGDPKFADPSNGDYHIGPGSAAIDQGMDAGVTDDMDGDPRPMRSGYDIGADEQPPEPVAGFTHSAPDWVGQTVVFSNTTVATRTVSYLWVFGDGSSSTAISPTHTYTSPGIYTVALTATNYGGSSVVTDTFTIYGALFTSSSPDWLSETTAFTNTSVTSGTTTYLWSFGDALTSTIQSPTHIYAGSGLYTVILTATSDTGVGAVSASVTVYGSPAADFFYYPTTGVCPLTVVFTDTTTSIPPGDPTLTHLWSFGDGVTDTLPSPTHTYNTPGAFTVSLTAGNAAGSDTETKGQCVNVLPQGLYLPLILRH